MNAIRKDWMPFRAGIAIWAGFALWALLGCSVPPPESTARDVIVRHFEARDYRVVNLELGEISPMPLGEKTYMGTRGFNVHVRSITLEAASPGGRRQTFENGDIFIKEKTGPGGGWTVSNISGIFVN
ncbi:MAG: hypothetical protein Kow0025_08490 [Thermodesulfovibrionales bacterium]